MNKNHKHKWKVIETIWPYPYGFGVFCKGCETLLEAGLPKKLAELYAKRQNKETKNE